MASVLDPKQLHSESEYRCGREMRDLILSDPETPAGRRFDDLLRLIGGVRGRLWSCPASPRRAKHEN